MGEDELRDLRVRSLVDMKAWEGRRGRCELQTLEVNQMHLNELRLEGPSHTGQLTARGKYTGAAVHVCVRRDSEVWGKKTVKAGKVPIGLLEDGERRSAAPNNPGTKLAGGGVETRSVV